MKSIYKSKDAKNNIRTIHNDKLLSLPFPTSKIDVNTSFGMTRVYKAGNPNGRKVIVFHGVHAGSAVALEALEMLLDEYKLIAIDTIGQATMSADVKIDISDNSFALWADEVLNTIGIEKADFIGISYGAFILQKVMTHKPDKISKAVMVGPSGLANGDLLSSLTKLTLPLMKFMITKSDKSLNKFLSAFVPENDHYMHRFQRAILTGVNMDYRKPDLLRKEDIEHFTKPVYIITADNDVFFPSNKTLNRAQEIFPNIEDTHVLQNCKHLPSKEQYPEIQSKLLQWLAQ